MLQQVQPATSKAAHVWFDHRSLTSSCEEPITQQKSLFEAIEHSDPRNLTMSPVMLMKKDSHCGGVFSRTTGSGLNAVHRKLELNLSRVKATQKANGKMHNGRPTQPTTWGTENFDCLTGFRWADTSVVPRRSRAKVRLLLFRWKENAAMINAVGLEEISSSPFLLTLPGYKREEMSFTLFDWMSGLFSCHLS